MYHSGFTAMLSISATIAGFVVALAINYAIRRTWSWRMMFAIACASGLLALVSLAFRAFTMGAGESVFVAQLAGIELGVVLCLGFGIAGDRIRKDAATMTVSAVDDGGFVAIILASLEEDDGDPGW